MTKEETLIETALKDLHRDRALKTAAEKRIKEYTKYLKPFIVSAEKNGIEVGIMAGSLVEGCQKTIKRDLLRAMSISDARIDRATVDSSYSWIKTKVLL